MILYNYKMQLIAAIRLMSSIPIPDYLCEHDNISHIRRCTWAFPIVGVILGIINGCFCYTVITIAGVSQDIAVIFTIVINILLTYGLHEDGLADTFDGIGGGRTPERIHSIMKDSRLGTFGCLAIVLSVFIRWCILREIPMLSIYDTCSIFIVSGTISRCWIPYAMRNTKYTDTTGMAQSLGRPSLYDTYIALIIGIISALATYNIIAFIIPACVALIFHRLIQLKIQRPSGDALGAGQQISEIIALFVVYILSV